MKTKRTDSFLNITLFSLFFLFSFILLSFLFTTPTHAATVYWDGGGSDDNWGTPANWRPDGIPTSTDDVKVTGTVSNKNIDVTSTIQVDSLSVTNTYSGTIIVTNTKSNITVSTTDILVSSTNAAVLDFNTSTVDMSGDLTVVSGTVSSTSGNLKTQGNIDLSPSSRGATFNHGSGTVILDGPTASKVTSSGHTFNSLEINKSSGSDTVTLFDNLDGDGNVDIVNGTLDVNTKNVNMNVGGDWNNSGGTFTEGSGSEKVIFDGSSNQKIQNGETFNELAINNSSNIVSSTAALTVVSATVKNGTFRPYHKTDFNGSGGITVNSGATLDAIRTTTLFVSSTWENQGTFTKNSSTIDFDGTSTTTVTSSAKEFWNVKVNKPTSTNKLVPRDGLRIKNNFTLNSGWVDPGAASITNKTLSVTGTTNVKEPAKLFGFKDGTSTFYGDLILHDPDDQDPKAEYQTSERNNEVSSTLFRDSANLVIEAGSAYIANTSSISFENGRTKLYTPTSSVFQFGEASIAQPTGGGKSKTIMWWHPATIIDETSGNKLKFPSSTTMTLNKEADMKDAKGDRRVSSTPSDFDNSAIKGNKGMKYSMPGNPSTDKAVTVTLKVDSSRNGDTLYAIKNDSESNGWTTYSDNRSCVVTNGECSYTTKDFSQFSGSGSTGGGGSSSSGSSSGGGGGGGGSATAPAPTQQNASIVIEGGASTTADREVTVEFNVNNADKVALSEKPDFGGISLQPYPDNNKMNFKLSAGSGEKTVYARFVSPDGLRLNSEDSIKLTGDQCPLSAGKAYTPKKNNAVYYITDECTKRPFRNPQVYFTYFDAWSDTVVADWSTLQDLKTDGLGFMPWGPKKNVKAGQLFKSVESPKVYIQQANGNKCWIKNESVFNKLNYSFDNVWDIHSKYLKQTPSCSSPIDYTDHHPNHTLIKYSDSNDVYLLEPNKKGKQVKRLVKNMKVFKRKNLSRKDIVTIDKSETYPSGNPME